MCTNILCCSSDISIKSFFLPIETVSSAILASISTGEYLRHKSNIDLSKFDYVLDCCDSVNTKILLIEKCKEYNVKLITAMGTGNRLDPSKLIITDIWKTNYDPLAKKIRSILRKKKIDYKIKVVTSTEIPRKSKEGVGSLAFVPNCAGFFMASFVINDII